MKGVLVETGMGNLHSVERALHAAALLAKTPPLKVLSTRDPDKIVKAERLVVPGQGGFAQGAHDQSLRDCRPPVRRLGRA